MRHDRPIRLAILNYRDEAITGGSLRVGETIANNLNPERIEAHLVFAYGDPGPVAKKALVPCHYLRAKGPKDFKAWVRARKTILELKPDIIHFMENVVWLQAALLGTVIPRIVHMHGPFVPSQIPWKNKLIWKITKKIVQHHICITSGMRNFLVDCGWTTPDKSSVIYNSIDCGSFRNRMDKKQARSYLGLPQGALMLGMVCRLVANKGGLDFLSILHRLPGNWQGVLCGDGPQRGELVARCQELGLTDRVHFLGIQDDVVPVYAALDAYAFLTHNEPFGLVLAEAMAAEVPVFGLEGDGDYRDPGYPLVTDNNVVLMPRGRPSNDEQTEAPDVLDEVARRISRYGENPHRYRGMIEHARQWVNTRFAAHIQAEAMLKVYEQLLNLPGSGESANMYFPNLSTPSETTNNKLIRSN